MKAYKLNQYLSRYSQNLCVPTMKFRIRVRTLESKVFPVYCSDSSFRLHDKSCLQAACTLETVIIRLALLYLGYTSFREFSWLFALLAKRNLIRNVHKRNVFRTFEFFFCVSTVIVFGGLFQKFMEFVMFPTLWRLLSSR